MTTEPTTPPPPPPPPPPAISYLALPGRRHQLSDRIAGEVVAELEQLHFRCLAGVTGAPIDAGAALVEFTARGRIRFVGGGSSAAVLDSDLVDAVAHAARAGYQLCLNRPAAGADTAGGYPCWLPAGHPWECEHRGWWRWSLLYGYRGPARLVCARCTPHRHVPAPDDCPHQ